MDSSGRVLGRWDIEHLGGLTSALRERHIARIVLSAQTDTPYATVITVMDAAREGGVDDVSFGAQDVPR
jgi:biopolymer transport protein ExbD